MKSEYSHVKRMNFCTEQVHSFVYTKSRETEIGVKMMNTLEIKNLTKKFGDFIAVDNMSLSIKEGEIFGF